MAGGADWVKDPGAVLDWKFDWSNWLQPGETITTSDMTLTPGVVLDSETNTSTAAVAWVSGGQPGTPYRLTNKIVTNQGRTDERSITIRVQSR